MRMHTCVNQLTSNQEVDPHIYLRYLSLERYTAQATSQSCGWCQAADRHRRPLIYVKLLRIQPPFCAWEVLEWEVRTACRTGAVASHGGARLARVAAAAILCILAR